jgi:hypothetical protein
LHAHHRCLQQQQSSTRCRDRHAAASALGLTIGPVPIL